MDGSSVITRRCLVCQYPSMGVGYLEEHRDLHQQDEDGQEQLQSPRTLG